MKKLSFISVVAILLFVPAIYGRTITVSSDPGVGDVNSIQAAIDDANDGDEIEVAPGIYPEAINFNGKAIRLYSSDGPEETTIDGTGYYHVVQCVSGEDANTILDGFTITGGNANGSETKDKCGGGMYNSDSSPTVTNCRFSGNRARWGGGMHNYRGSPILTSCAFNDNTAEENGGGIDNNSSNPTVTDCSFSGNNAVTHGGGMFNVESSPKVSGCSFSQNTAGTNGGGMENWQGSSPTVAKCSFSQNTTDRNGGGMFNDSDSSPTVTGCTFSQNTAKTDGGGMENRTRSRPTVADCTFSQNTAGGNGGGMFNNTDCSPTVTNCTFSNNSALYGGGMYNINRSHSIVTDCTFSDNEASHSGGGMFNNDASSPTVSSCTFTGNRALSAIDGNGGGMRNWKGSNAKVANCKFSSNTAMKYGGGMFNDNSRPTVTNCIFNQNIAQKAKGGGIANYNNSNSIVINCTFCLNSAPHDVGGGIRNWDSSPTVTNCIIWDNEPDEISSAGTSAPTVQYCDVQGGRGQPWFSTGCIDANPVFLDPAHGDLSLGGCSPCVDAGNNTAVQAGLTTDLAGNSRFVDDTGVADTGAGTAPIVDMGAYERQSDSIRRGTIKVPGDFDGIQKAISEAYPGDQIVVAPGTYKEAINFSGKAIRLCSSGGPEETTIDGTGHYHVVQCVSGEDANTILEGFTITGGKANGSDPKDKCGGGMYNSDSSPTVTNCRFSGNKARWGGGVHNYKGSPILTKCAFSGNMTTVNGGGIDNNCSNPTVTDCSFSGNNAITHGGGMFNVESSPNVTNCTFTENTASFGGAMYNASNSNPNVTNCILWADSPDEIDSDTQSTPIVTYCDVLGSWPGTGNIHADPLFVLTGDIHLLFGSPCIDAGTNTPQERLPAEDIDGTDRVLDGDEDGTTTVDMGAYEFNPDRPSSWMAVWPLAFKFIAYGGQAPEPELLEIRNIGSGTLHWAIDIDERCSWLELNRTRGQSSGEVDNLILDPNISGLDPGEYHCMLTLKDPNDPNAINTPAIISVTLCVGCERHVPEKYSTIQSAIAAAGDGDIIVVADGIYEENNLDFGGRAIMVKSENGPEQCIIDCNDLGRGFYFHSGETHDSILDGFTIRYGNVPADPNDDKCGGGIYIDEASPTIRNCIFEGCRAEMSGGAIHLRDSVARISDCMFNGNSATYGGGGMYNHISWPVVINCTFSSNKAAEGKGGAMQNDRSNASVTNCTFTNNTAGQEGGGMYNISCNPAVTGCNFSGNNAATDNGGGMFNDNSSPTVTNCTFTSNASNVNGGGMANLSSSPAVTNCTFSSNTATKYGGGMFNDNSRPTVTNCIFNQNIAQKAKGGGIANYNNSNSIVINCTFCLNSAPHDVGGGIRNWNSSPTVTNCIIWDNEPDEISSAGTSAPTVQYCGVQGGTGQPRFSTGCIDANPVFLDPANGDFRLQVGSPCIDVGKNIAGIYCDIRGSVRPIAVANEGGKLVNNNFDMGAYEFSRFHSGIEDGNVPAFTDVETPSFCLVGEPVKIRWKNHSGFPDGDRRITDPQKYQVNLVLVSEDRVRQTKLNTESITVPSTTLAPDIPYTHEYTFRTIHAGRWYLRIELSEDRNQYVESAQTFLIGLRQPMPFEIGKEITPPFDVDLTVDPKIEEGREDYFYWSKYARKLYATGPIAAVVEWTDAKGDPLPILVGNSWPDEMQIHIADSPSVELLPKGGQFSFVEVRYAENDAAVNGSLFSATSEGRCVLMYGENTNYEFIPEFEVVKTVLWNNPEHLREVEWSIGSEVTEPNHNDDCGSGHIYQEISPYDPNIYDRETRSGQIFAVNLDDPCSTTDDLIVFWYQKGKFGADWPYLPKRYDPKWPSLKEGLEKIVIASCEGSEVYDQNSLDDSHRNMQIYNQPDAALAGYNPNEEHAAFFPSQHSTYQAVFALRNDLNQPHWNKGNYTSEPYVLLKYQDVNDMWHYRVFEVLVECEPVTIYDNDYPGYYLEYGSLVGTLMQPPYPLVRLRSGSDEFSYPDPPGPEGPRGRRGPWWVDYRRKIWARRDTDTERGTIRWFYSLPAGFYYDLDNDGVQDEPVGTYVPWLSYHTDPNESYDRNKPIAVKYKVNWPSNVPELQVGETLMKPKRGLPDIMHQSSVEIIYDEPYEVYGKARAVKLIDPLRERTVDCSPEYLSGIRVRNKGGMQVFDDLPFHLRMRFCYDPLKEQLVFKGHFDDTVVGEPILLLNVITVREKGDLLDLDGKGDTSTDWDKSVNELYDRTHTELDRYQTKVVGGTKALSAGAAGGEGYVTLIFADDPNCSPLPISVEVIKVFGGPYRGEIKVIESDNVFDERITFKHSGDFGGRPEGWLFQWKCSYSPDEPNVPDRPRPGDNWQDWSVEPPAGNGVVDITVGGAGLIALQDLWFSCRYRDKDELYGLSSWTEPQLHESWIKRVMRQVNLFDQRFKDFHETEINTLVSMIGQIGQSYEGDVALTADPENINSLGMLELYATLFRRVAEFSIDASPPISDASANATLLFASSRIAALYTLLGNEAYADALDPTTGFTTEGADYGVMAPAIHCFQNQTDSLLSEELALLRGREADPHPRPLYNRLAWNFTSGDGEVAYASNYAITDMDMDGDIDEYDARIMYPQGHGDAWGHYLMALKTYYRLLADPNYAWASEPEYVLVAGTPVKVGYFHERQFAKIAAAKAKAGAEIVDLTYRQRFDEDPEYQWKGYKDSDPNRAWGVAGWASRAGQGAYFDWVVANALLPDEDPNEKHTGLQKVDRTTVLETRNIAASFNEIQSKLDMADIGENPVGVARDAIPFDINPWELVDVFDQPSGRTHFEQIYDRTLQALNNALVAFNFANRNTQLLRRQQDSLEDFMYNVEQRELDFRSRLIEIYGYPYSDDIGPAGTYPEGYDGPDLYHFMYVDASNWLPDNLLETKEIPVPLKTYGDEPVDEQGNLNYEEKELTLHFSPYGLGFIKPAGWTGSREAPGELQLARSDLLQARLRFEKALVDYDILLTEISHEFELLQALYGLDANEIHILNRTRNWKIGLNSTIVGLRIINLAMKTWAEYAEQQADAAAETLPLHVGVWGGDITAPGRGAIKALGATAWWINHIVADVAEVGELAAEQAKEIVEAQAEIDIATHRYNFEEAEQLERLHGLVLTEPSLRLELYTLQENMQQAAGRYDALLARGKLLYQDLVRFRRETAADVQHYRYKDMTFRIFRNDALQKYRAQFDLAARYAYLAAKAYDYETALLDDHSDTGQHFLNRIVKQRTLGQISKEGRAMPIDGLAGVLAEMKQNFDVFKTMMGFNNPQIETTWFSLRKENFGITDHSKWQNKLNECRVVNLWDRPEFRRYCRPFDTEDMALPGLVIPFQTNIINGLNFFGRPGGANPYYAPENFATKIRAVGVWFSDYDPNTMSPTPRVYLIPVGHDKVRADIGEIRSWQVVEQSIPAPFQIGEYELANDFEWIPMNDSIPSPLAEIRRYTRFRAYPDDGFDPSQMTYDSRLIGRSVWNTRWLLIIPGHSLYPSDPWKGIKRFITGVTDIKLFFKTYAYPGS